MVLHNPNNWHWVDKNCIQWSRDYFNTQLPETSAENDQASVKVTKVRNVEGDVDVCQRKGKVISLYDLHLELEYDGKCGDVDATGRIKVPEVAYDTEEDEFQFNISIDDETAEKAPIKALVREKLVPQLRKKLLAFGVDLIETHGKDIQHQDKKLTAQTLQPLAQADDGKKVVGSSTYNTTTLKLKPTFTASAEQLYKAFLDKPMVAAWSRASPDIEAKEGSDYSLFNGNIVGKVVKLEENKKIVMTWRLRDWKEGHFATITMDFDQGSGETVLNVNWTGIPIGQEEIVENNFQNYYVKPIMLTFGYGLP